MRLKIEKVKWITEHLRKMIINKYKLLQNLHETYCTLGVSKKHGLGVIAIRDIPANVNPLPITQEEMALHLTEGDLEDLPKEVASRVRDLSIRVDGKYGVNSLGLNGCGVRFYINHSENPNVSVNKSYRGLGFMPFITLKEIKKGEELFFNYTDTPGDNILNQFKFIKNE